ncbi:MAG: ATP-dependent metallopeptidase FtsH/Yme1/Tma family protein [Deltaproteobacteria bacterium]|nr:ATP-dependent metallopeptidase FtsH/Yme1/Tma family protein [Deltaproteobacteria bacterium]
MQKNDDEPKGLLERLKLRLGSRGSGGPPKPGELRKRQLLSAALVMLLVLVLSNFLGRSGTGRVETIPYSAFKQLLQEDKVKDLLLETEQISGTSAEAKGKERKFVTVRVEDPQLVPLLDQKKVAYRAKTENRWMGTLLGWVLPIALMLLFWRFMTKRMGSGPQGLLSVGKAKARIYAETATGVTFADVAGIDEAEAELQEIVAFLKTPEKFQRLGGRIPKGVLLVGAPGTGKTLLARAVAGEAGVPFFSMSGSEFVEMFVGVGASRVRDLFAQAKKTAPCIIFIDELDALGKARGLNPMGGHDEREQTLNQLLVEMDGFDPNVSVIIMAATNRPEILDPALLRAGRFDRHVAIDRPDVKGREAILRIHVGKVKLGPDVALREVAAMTPGFAGADLANLVNEAALLAARRDLDEVTMREFREAVDRITGGLEKRNRAINPKEKRIVAHHEAGHAVVAMSLEGADPVNKISIIPRGFGALGYTKQLPTEDRYLMTREELLIRVRVLLGGRVAEELIFGDVSTGAQNDLQRATEIVRSMVTDYGMSERLGVLTYGQEPRSPYLAVEGAPRTREFSEKTAQEIDEEMSRIIDEALQAVRSRLTAKKSLLERLAGVLLEREALEGEELEPFAREARDIEEKDLLVLADRLRRPRDS